MHAIRRFLVKILLMILSIIWTHSGYLHSASPVKRLVAGEGWNEWSDCTQECGSGIMYQKKCHQGDCQNLPQMRYRSCNVQPCLIKDVDIRTEQCQAFNSADDSESWSSAAPRRGESECQLLCISNVTSKVVLKSPTVPDGTKCLEGGGVCIQGSCIRLGCDGKLGSPIASDKCHRCHLLKPENQGQLICRKFVGQVLKKRLNKHTNRIVSIPPKSSYINITTLGTYRNHIRVRLQGKQSLQMRVTADNPVSLGGTKFKLIKDHTCDNCIEKWAVLADGPTDQPLTITVGRTDQNYGIVYSYYTVIKRNQTLPVRQRRGRNSKSYLYSWEPGPKGQCSVTCGTGMAVTRYQCIVRVRGHLTNVPDAYCRTYIGPKPTPIVEICHQPDCNAKWSVGGWGQCSTQCEGGVRQRKVECVVQESSGQQMIHPSNDCPVSTRPVHEEACGTAACQIEWKISEWNDCSGACGENAGVQHRLVLCYNVTPEASIIVNDLECSGQIKPINVRPCSINCSTAEWETHEWSHCKGTCGMNGVQTRDVYCVLDDGVIGRIVNDTVCNSTKPIQEESCYVNCEWRSSPWSKCVKKGGRCRQTRQVQCLSGNGNTKYSGCNPYIKPASSQPCCCDIWDPSACLTIRPVHSCSTNLMQTMCCETCNNG